MTGRPSKYKPEYCQMLIDHMGNGYSFESFAGIINVCTDSLYNWQKMFPDFLEAHKVGHSNNRVFWESKALENLVDI